jgi:copper(I)-binding protein
MRFLSAIAAALAALAFSAQAMAGDVTVDRAWARASIGTDRPGVAYMTIVNKGGTLDRLSGVSTPVAGRAEIHQSVMADGVMKMRAAGAIDIEPGATVTLEPGGLHLMLMSLKRELKEGDGFPLTLIFAQAGEVTVHVAVAGIGAKQAPTEHHRHHEQHEKHEHDDYHEHQEHHEHHHE